MADHPFNIKNEKTETPIAFIASILLLFISETINLIFMAVFCSVGREDRIIMKHQLSLTESGKKHLVTRST